MCSTGTPFSPSPVPCCEFALAAVRVRVRAKVEGGGVRVNYVARPPRRSRSSWTHPSGWGSYLTGF